MPSSNPIKRIFDLYTSDLSYQEIEKLVKREANEVYEFFKADIPKPDPTRSKLYRSFVFIKSLFNAFIMKLNPARRIFYLISIFFFFVGYSQPNNMYLFMSFIILNLLIAFELADKLLAKGELEVARKIQSDLIPKHAAQINGYEISTFYEPAREVGGDYFDVIETPERTFVVVGDVSGKGMAAALYMVRVQSILYMLIENYTDLKEIMINLDKSGEIDYDEIQDQIHALYKKLKKANKPHLEIFNEIADKIHRVTLQDAIFCQIVVSYFVQSCEVFDAITE